MSPVEKFNSLAAFYEQLKTLMAAICVQKGGIPIDNYAGRFFAADVLEMLADLGGKTQGAGQAAEKYREEFERVRDLASPSQKPIHEMTLEEFEKVMNI